MALFQSRRFWTVIVDVVISLVTFFVAKYAAPALVEDVKFVIVTMQPIFILLIAAYTHEDVQAAKLAAANPGDPQP